MFLYPFSKYNFHMFCFENWIFGCLGFKYQLVSGHQYQAASDEFTGLGHEHMCAADNFLVLICTDTSVFLKILNN